MSKVCVIYPTESLVDEFGSFFEGKVGVCIIDGEHATTSIVHRSELRSVTSGLACVPSQGGRIHLLPLDDELEAYRRIRQEAANLAFVSRPALPLGFYKPQALWFGMFALSIEVGSMRIRVGHGLATALGWREGDGVALGISSDQRTLAFCYDAAGSRLTGGDLIASYPLGVGLPRELETLSPGEWVPVAIEVRDQIVFVRLEDFISGARKEEASDNPMLNTPDRTASDGDVSNQPRPVLAALYWCLGGLNKLRALTRFFRAG
ncbi:hypothetical protein [Rhizobium sp. MHM7A]|uniref:hypothetical protein n=1 Tax=Rhizobium sp. MHM7A TaxID=2583233 RepID=UPI0011062B62|nr:hypothetical protein [Rhizobium sp. MHM7A]TLX16947.1 hypothetical protein FFR93_06295 [Rhizobium sp. MHM7A]